MLKIRDQENWIHDQQAAVAAKALKNGERQVTAKTPGPLAPRTPFKIPLNDENDRRGFVRKKEVVDRAGKGDENVQYTGKKILDAGKSSCKTPLGHRAPLGQKTTNAKAKGDQVPHPIPETGDVAKTRQRSASARKKARQASHLEPVSIDVLSDKHYNDDNDIGVIHPRPKDLSDAPMDLPELDFSVLEGNFAEHAMRAIYNRPGRDGLNLLQRKQMKDAEDLRIIEARDEAMIKRSVDLHAAPPCTHNPFCPGDECKNEPERRRQIEEEYRRTVKSIFETTKKATESREESSGGKARYRSVGSTSKSTFASPKPKQETVRTTLTSAVAPSSLSKAGANKLKIKPAYSQNQSQTNGVAAHASVRPVRHNATKISTAASEVSSSSRHAAATRVSRTTMGYAQSRATAGEKRPSILPKRDVHVFRSQAADEGNVEGNRVVGNEAFRCMLVDDALDDFQLEMPED